MQSSRFRFHKAQDSEFRFRLGSRVEGLIRLVWLTISSGSGGDGSLLGTMVTLGLR